MMVLVLLVTMLMAMLVALMAMLVMSVVLVIMHKFESRRRCKVNHFSLLPQSITPKRTAEILELKNFRTEELKPGFADH
jgi:hypothetical protein